MGGGRWQLGNRTPELKEMIFMRSLANVTKVHFKEQAEGNVGNPHSPDHTESSNIKNPN